jgi:hypothetical protein
VLARTPEQHQHLVSDVVKGDLDGLFVKVYGLAARDPKRYCKAILTRMSKLPLDMESCNLMAHQWVLGQYEYFDTTQGASCDSTYKMPECDFVDLVVDVLEVYMPKFIGIYRRDEVVGKAWTSDILMDHIKALASKGQLKVEKDAQKQHKVATNLLRQHQHEAMPYGVNESDTRWEYDSYGYGSPFDREFDDHHRHSKGQKGKGTGSWYAYHKGRKGKGGWYDRGGHGSYGSYGGGYDGDCHGDGYGGNSNSDRGWKREHGHANSSPSRKALHCTNCEEAGEMEYIVSGHDKATCGLKGGDMGGYGHRECTEKQSAINNCTMAGLAINPVQVFRTKLRLHWEFLRLWTGFELPSSWTALPCYGLHLYRNRNILDFMRWPRIKIAGSKVLDEYYSTYLRK